jgi:hypothetical protein
LNSLAHKTPSYDTKIIPKVVFDKTICVKFKILVLVLNKTLMKHIQNNQKSKGKSIPPMDFKNLKKRFVNQRLVTFANICDFQKENHTLGYVFQNL